MAALAVLIKSCEKTLRVLHIEAYDAKNSKLAISPVVLLARLTTFTLDLVQNAMSARCINHLAQWSPDLFTHLTEIKFFADVPPLGLLERFPELTSIGFGLSGAHHFDAMQRMLAPLSSTLLKSVYFDSAYSHRNHPFHQTARQLGIALPTRDPRVITAWPVAQKEF